MTQIVVPIFENAEEWLKENLQYIHCDGISAVYPAKWKFDENFGRKYYDEEENKTKYADFQRHVWALEELTRLIANKKLFVGGITNPIELTDTSNWDVEVGDAYFQLCYHDEVIYG